MKSERASNNNKREPGASATNSFNENRTARPRSSSISDSATDEVGEMNIQDAKDLGYTDEQGQAVDTARPNREGSPTGAYTDVGAGRSSAVRKATDVSDEPH